jgi:hypothetical protein
MLPTLLRAVSASAIAREIEALLRIREDAERTALYLIDMLDAYEPDVDLEDGDSGIADPDAFAELAGEPVLGWTMWEAGAAGRHGKAMDEAEEDDPGEEAGDEHDPSLGWLCDYTGARNQANPNCRGGTDDREACDADLGIADSDALHLYEEERATLTVFERQTIATDAAWSAREALRARGLPVTPGQRESRALVITGPDGGRWLVSSENLLGREVRS